jgi:tetratricopeptide (TPR) repeat protein
VDFHSVSIDRAKALQSAQKYLAKGQLDRAITEYERLVQADPKDARMLLKLGDLYTRQGASKDASATYRKVAEQYAEQGFFLKAVAVCKQILKLDPTQLDVWERLAEMYEMLSLVSDAITTYEQVADAQQRANNPRKALRALQKLAELDAENVAARIRYAEALSKLNRPEEAAAAFREGAELLKKQGRFEDYVKVGERLLFHQPDNYEFARELAAMYLERGDAKHSLAKLQTCFNADPKNLETLQLLARAFEQLGQTQKTISVLKEIARLHASESRRTEHGSVLRRILVLDPADSEARRELSQLARLPHGANARTEQSSTIDVSEDDYDLVLEDDTEADTSKNGSDARSLGAPDHEETYAKVQRLLDECAVFVRYGLTDKIIAQLHEVLELDPRHGPAREKLKDAYLRAKRPGDAVKQLLVLAELVAAREPARAESYLREALRLDPNNDNAKERLQAFARSAPTSDEELIFVDEAATGEQPATQRLDGIGRPEESFASLIPDSEVEFDSDGDIELEVDDEEPELMVEDGSVAEAFEHQLDAQPHEQFDEQLDEPLAQQPDAQPHEQFDEQLDEPLDDDDAMVIEAEEDDEEPVLVVEDSTVAALPWPPESVLPPPPAADVTAFEAPEAIEEELPEELIEVLGEIDFYLKQELYEEAQQTLSDALDSFPDHPLLLIHQTALDGMHEGIKTDMPPPASPPPPLAAPVRDRSFELAQKLAEEVAPVPATSSGAGPVDMADVLAQFKRGVAKQVDKKDAATHHDLGIAYMEMGLQVEAIEEFKLCLDDPLRQCSAHTMIALSYVAKGDMDLGIDHFKLALAAKPSPPEEIGLWFELGNAHELLGKNMEALIWYEKVEERDNNFRDVALRIERLGTARTPEQESDEFDEMFDSMILKD